MSTCVSGEGEYGAHILDADFSCTRCFTLDEDALLADRDQWRQHAANLTDVGGALRVRLDDEIGFLHAEAVRLGRHPDQSEHHPCPAPSCDSAQALLAKWDETAQ